jgi:hypothetical protein
MCFLPQMNGQGQGFSWFPAEDDVAKQAFRYTWGFCSEDYEGKSAQFELQVHFVTQKPYQ